MQTTEILAAIDEEIARLQQARNLIGGSSRSSELTKLGHGTGNGLAAAKKKRTLSPEARKRIADAQKKRWAAEKKAAK
ncbi:hypothetical protein HNQ77_002661 [Silvibacterium bohemicum]|uniref:Uncharacterized protein n=1 Tax=Silvibacterium bohemicum TaxID=1577686 RepID=A0A841JVY2_9BACT|nr:hypothetical protein [Silvibacterium bohemicum]MBB6144705.1 hypothetical protein [Silvibacterium bohemicum]